MPLDPQAKTNLPPKQPEFLIIFHLVTAGKQGPDSGSDEYPIVLLTAKIVNLFEQNVHSPEFQAFIKPVKQTGDVRNSQLFPDPKIDGTLDNVISDAKTGDLTDRPNQLETPSFACDSSTTGICMELTEECKRLTGLTDELLSEAGTLNDAIKLFNQWIQEQISTQLPSNAQSIDNSCDQPDSNGSSKNVEDVNATQSKHTSFNGNFVLVTDGPITLRLLFHPEATSKSIDLSEMPHFYRYLDLSKEYNRLYHSNSTVTSVIDMLRYLNLPHKQISRELVCSSWENDFTLIGVHAADDVLAVNMELGSEFGFQHPQSSDNAVEPNNVSRSESGSSSPVQQDASQTEPSVTESTSLAPGSLPMEYCRSIATLVKRMTTDGADWTNHELIHTHYQPAIVRKTDPVEDDLVVRARGLPWQATDLDIFRFFSGLNISEGGISLVLSKIGRRNGEALVRFTNREQRTLALRKHKHHMGQRYIEVYAAQGADFIAFAGGETEEAEAFLRKFTSPYQALIRMRGLPYTATAEQIIQFFENSKCPVQFGEEGVLFVNRRDGRATGDAFVIFESQSLAEEALKSHRQHIGNRYIELFKSTPAEVNQVMNTVLNPPGQLPTSWGDLSMDVESALNAAAAMAAGTFTDLTGASNPNEYNFTSGSTPNMELLSHLAFNLPPQTLGFGCPLLNGSSSFHAYPASGNALLPPFYHPQNFGSIPVSTFDPLLYHPDHLSSFSTLQSSPTLFPTDSVGNGLNSMGYSVPFTGLSIPSNITPTTSITTIQPTVLPYTVQANQWTQWATAGLTLPLDHLAKYFIRIKGMPLDTDILDILTFLEDSWRNVALHGVHRVYNVLGQPTGEAIIQFVSEYVAQMVVEQKNGSLFVHRGVSVNSTTVVEVHQCTTEDLKQLMVTILTMLQNHATNESLLRSQQNILNGLGSFLSSGQPLSVPSIPLPNSTLLGSPTVVRPARIGTMGRMNDAFPIGINHPAGLMTGGAPPPPQPPTLPPTATATRLSTFPPPPAAPLVAPTMPTATGSETSNPVRMGPLIASNLQSGSILPCASVFSTLMDFQSPMMLHGLLPNLNTPHMGSTVPATITVGTPHHAVMTNTSAGFRECGNLCAPVVNQSMHTAPNTLTISSQIKQEKCAEEFDGKSPENQKFDHSGTLVTNASDQTIVQLKGLPKDVMLHEIAGLFGENCFNLKLSSIKMDYTNEGVPSGNASIFFQSRTEAERIIRTVDNALLRGHQIQVRILGKR